MKFELESGSLMPYAKSDLAFAADHAFDRGTHRKKDIVTADHIPGEDGMYGIAWIRSVRRDRRREADPEWLACLESIAGKYRARGVQKAQQGERAREIKKGFPDDEPSTPLKITRDWGGRYSAG
jgi:hypothetical protein